MAVGPKARLGFAAIGLGLGVPSHIADQKEIEPPVVVVIEPARRDGPATVRDQASVRRYILEGPVSAISIQSVRTDSRHEQVDEAIVVIVGGGCPHGIVDAGYTGFRSDVRKRAIVVVVEESIAIG